MSINPNPDRTETGPARKGSTERCANPDCGHTKRDHSGRRDHTTKHPNIPLRPWCHACESDCLYEPPTAAVSVVPPATNQTGLRDRIAAAIWERQNPGRRYADCEYRWKADAEADADAVLAVLPAPVDRAAVPVKQRADCTELEWAEQERARFERLYTRESVRADLAEQRADTAARDADIYQQRLERLSEGYTEQRQRAEAMERAMESTAADALAHRGCHRDLMAQCLRAERAEAEAERLRADRDATCICQHTEQQHFEDACLVCGCGDYLPPAAAREVIARWQEATGKAERIRENADFHLGQEMARRQLAEKEAARLSADRAAVLNAAAQHLYIALFPAVYADMGQKAAEGVNRAVSEMRRLAAEAPHTETPDERPPMDPRRVLGIDAQAETVHACPPDGSGLTPCCGRTPFELPRTDRISSEPAAVTCAPAVVAQPGKETSS